jgi:hypothetical protein
MKLQPRNGQVWQAHACRLGPCARKEQGLDAIEKQITASCGTIPVFPQLPSSNRPLFLLIRSFQQFPYLFGLDPASLMVSREWAFCLPQCI